MRRPVAVLDSVAESSATSDSSRSLEFIRQAANSLESGAATTMGVQASNAIRTHLRSLPNEDVSQNALSECAACKGHKRRGHFS